MKYKIIATDFDGTLINSKDEITEYTKEKLIEMRYKGHIIIGITGRILSSVLKKIDISLFDYLILCDGSFIYDTKKKEVSYASHLPNTVLEDITLKMIDKVSEVDYASLHNYYILKGKSLSKSKYIKEIESLNQIPEQISRITLFFKTNEEAEHYQKIIKEDYPIVNSFIMQDSFSDERRININMSGVNKVNTLNILAKKLNVELKNIIFFGDGLNDLEIFNSKVFSVAMGNALEEIKTISKDITLTNNEDGVAFYLEKL